MARLHLPKVVFDLLGAEAYEVRPNGFTAVAEAVQSTCAAGPRAGTTRTLKRWCLRRGQAVSPHSPNSQSGFREPAQLPARCEELASCSLLVPRKSVRRKLQAIELVGRPRPRDGGGRTYQSRFVMFQRPCSFEELEDELHKEIPPREASISCFAFFTNPRTPNRSRIPTWGAYSKLT